MPSMPCWFGEVSVIAHFLKREARTCGDRRAGARMPRRRFGHYDLIDFVAVLLGYAISGEVTLATFYEGVQPFADPFMALFGRERLPHRSTLSRDLSALDQATVEALRTLFLKDVVARPLESSEKPGGLWDREGSHWLVFDVDGTRQAARKPAVPQTADLPPVQRRLREVCAPGYLGRKRGEVLRTRTTLLQAHTHQWLGTFSGTGNGDYRGELLQARKRDQHLYASSAHSTEPGGGASGWPIWRWGHRGRSSGLRLRHARQGLSSTGSGSRPGALARSSGCSDHTSGKRDPACPLRFSAAASDSCEPTVPRHCEHPFRLEPGHPNRNDSRRRRLRALFYSLTQWCLLRR